MQFRSQKHIVLSVASSGIASLLLPKSRTTNSKFKIHYQFLTTPAILKQTKLIIWNETPITHYFCFQTLDKSIGDIIGKILVLGGDFRQILPMVPRGCLLTLTKNMGLQNHDNTKDIKQFSEWILKMGNGKLYDLSDSCVETDIVEELLIVNYDNPIVSNTYPNLQNHYKD
ncbi:hypothetical protein Lal_00027432 [Lupinus albus]|nr:hypothetical protein Lal_00027432 [Lupinus albus]